MAPDRPRLAAALALAALVPLFVALFLPWGSFVAEADDGFSMWPGCEGPFVEGEYRLVAFSFGIIDRDGELVEECLRVALFWAFPDPALPLAVIATGLAVLATAAALWSMPGGRSAAAGGVALIAALTVALCAWNFIEAVQGHVEMLRTQENGYLRQDPDAFGWAAGLWGAAAGGLLLVGSGVLSLLPGRPVAAHGGRGDASGETGEAPATAEAHEGAARTTGDAAGTTGDAAGTTGGTEAGADAQTPGAGPRRLSCPRCRHRFLAKRGVEPRCPACGHSRPGKAQAKR